MESTSTQPLDLPTSPQASHEHFHTGRRLRRLLRPNGRRVHIAATPEEHVRLTRYVCFGVILSCLLLSRNTRVAKRKTQDANRVWRVNPKSSCLLLRPVSSLGFLPRRSATLTPSHVQYPPKRWARRQFRLLSPGLDRTCKSFALLTWLVILICTSLTPSGNSILIMKDGKNIFVPNMANSTMNSSLSNQSLTHWQTSFCIWVTMVWPSMPISRNLVMTPISVRIKTGPVQRRKLIHRGIGTKDPDSSTNSLSGDRSSSHRDWEAERRKGQALKFYKKPTIRQYWHRGLLWRASEVEGTYIRSLYRLSWPKVWDMRRISGVHGLKTCLKTWHLIWIGNADSEIINKRWLLLSFLWTCFTLESYLSSVTLLQRMQQVLVCSSSLSRSHWHSRCGLISL